MKRHFNWTIILIISMTLLSCQRDIELNEVINQNSQFILTQIIQKVESKQSDFKIDTLRINSEKWKGLINFMSNNKNNWKPTPASYISDFYIEQNEFKLVGWKDGKTVVISYKDKSGKIEQLTKEIIEGELNFLTE